MKHSIITKFQGAYIGSFISNQLSSNNIFFDNKLDSHLVIQDIINDLDNDFTIWRKYFFLVSQSLTASTIILSLLPWILFYHDNWYQLQNLIIKVAQETNLKSEDRELIEVWIYGLVLVLREKIDNKNPIEKIIYNKQLQHDLNFKQLQLIEKALSKGKNSKQFIEKLLIETSNYSRIELLLSLYLFFSIPEDFALIVKRAIVVSQQFLNTVRLTAALAGAYNSLEGIPLYWLNSTKNHQGVINHLTIIKKLFIFWSGAYRCDECNIASSIIALPQTFQRRSNLKIISQQEYR